MNAELVWVDSMGLAIDGRLQTVKIETAPRAGDLLALDGQKETGFFEVVNVIRHWQLPPKEGDVIREKSISIFIRETVDPHHRPAGSRFGFGG
jgi:hypothetical protein